MSSLIKLIQAHPGDILKVSGFSEEGKLTSRLVEMGILPGVILRLIKIAPLKGPIEVKVRGYYVSIRQDDAQCIIVEKVS